MSKKDKSEEVETEEVTMEDMPAVDHGAAEEEEQISKVREILFGSRSRQIEGSVSRLEDLMRAEHATIRKEFQLRFDSLEEFIKGEIKAVLEQLGREETDRTEAVKKLQETLDETGEELSQKAGELHKRLDDSERELRDQILQARQTLTDELRDRTQELNDKLHSEAKKLRKGKADKNPVASLLTDVATRLTEIEDED